MNRAPLLGSGANKLNEALLLLRAAGSKKKVVQNDGLQNLVNKVLILFSNAQIPSNKQPLNSNIIIKAVREVAIKYKTTQGKPLLEFAVLYKLEEQVEKSVLILKFQLEKLNLNQKSFMKF
jgi:hypothetical protein